jgi:Protein of unknown function (DUF1648)
VLLLYWNDLPARVPTHFGATGVADRWGFKRHMILLPVIALSVYIVITLAVRFGNPGNSLLAVTTENEERQKAVMTRLAAWIQAEIVWLFALIEWQSIRVAMGRAEGLGGWFLPAVLLGNLRDGWLSYLAQLSTALSTPL